jgi:hypothetical protein
VTLGTISLPYPNSVAEWLEEIGLASYLEAFQTAGYDNILVCEELDESDLNNIGQITKPGHRKTLLLASKELKSRRKENPAGKSHFISQRPHLLFLILTFCYFYIYIKIIALNKKAILPNTATSNIPPISNPIHPVPLATPNPANVLSSTIPTTTTNRNNNNNNNNPISGLGASLPSTIPKVVRTRNGGIIPRITTDFILSNVR